MAGADPAMIAAPLAISFTTRDLVLILFRHRHRALAAMAVCLVIAVAASFLIAPLYQSEASIFINKLGREFTFRSEMGPGAAPIIPMTTDPEEILNTQVQLMRSRDVILATIDRFGLERLYPRLVRPDSPPDLDKVVEKFGDALKTVPQRTSNIIHIAFQHSDRALAAQVLETLIQIFRDKSIKVYINTQTQFYEEQVAHARDRFARADGLLTDFRQRHGVLAFDAQKALLLQQRMSFDTDLKKAITELEGAEARIEALRGSIDTVPRDVTAFTDTQQSRVVEDARSKLLNLSLRREEIAGSFAPTSRQVQQIDKEIAIARQFLAEQERKFSGTVRKARNEVLTAIETDLTRAQADRAAFEGRRIGLVARIAEIDHQITTMTAGDTERWGLERDVAASQETLKILMAKLEEARAADQLNKSRIGNVAIVQAPSLPDPRQPVQPKPLIYMVLGLIAGIFSAFVVAVLSELASDTIHDPVRTERLLGIPTLAVFNLVGAEARE